MSYLPCLNPSCKSHGRPHPNCMCYSGGEEYAEGGSICDRRIAHEMGCKYYKDGGDINHSADFGAAMHATGGIMNAHKGKSPEKHARNISTQSLQRRAGALWMGQKSCVSFVLLMAKSKLGAHEQGLKLLIIF